MDQTIFHCGRSRRTSPDCKANQRASKTECAAWRGKPDIKKSDCHLDATFKQRLNAVHKLHLQHKIKTLCRVLRVNRSTYYKHFHSAPAPRSAQNQELASLILRIHSEHRSFFKTIYSRNSSKKHLIWSGSAILLISKPAGNGIIFASLWTYSLEKLSPGTSLRSRILLLF